MSSAVLATMTRPLWYAYPDTLFPQKSSYYNRCHQSKFMVYWKKRPEGGFAVFWPRRLGTAMGPNMQKPLDLRSIAGLSGHLLFAEDRGRQQMTTLPCLVRKAGPAGIVVEVEGVPSLPKAGSAVILEVVEPKALLQCFTQVQSVGPGSRLVLRTPELPHVLQRRRFPRVELFLGISGSTADRPIDQLPAQMINLSIDGAACVIAEPLSPGNSLRLHLAAIGLHPPEVETTIIRCTPTPSHLWVIGVRFQSLSTEQEIYLGKYIADVTSLQNS